MPLPEHYYRTIIHRMMEQGARQNQTVHYGHFYTNGVTCFDVLEQTAGLCAMQHDTIFHSRKIDRNYVGLPLLHKRYMADQGFIQDAMDRLAVIMPTLGESSNAVAVGPGEIGHYYSFRFSSILQYQAFSNLPCLISRHETVPSFFHGRPFRGHNGKASRVTRDKVSRFYSAPYNMHRALRSPDARTQYDGCQV